MPDQQLKLVTSVRKDGNYYAMIAYDKQHKEEAEHNQPKPNAVQNLQKAKDVAESKSGQKADSLKQAADNTIQRVQEQQQKRATVSDTHKKKKTPTKPVQHKSAQQLKKDENARLDAEFHNKIQNLDGPWKDNQGQDEDGFDDFNDF